MGRIKFLKETNREFFDKIIVSLNSPSLRRLLQFGFDVNYSTLKNYYSGSRLIPEMLFMDLLEVSKLDEGNFSFEIIDENWGKIKGGKISKK